MDHSLFISRGLGGGGGGGRAADGIAGKIYYK